MKKSILIVLALLLLLTACHAAPAGTDNPTGSTPSSGSVTPPSSSVAPPASSVPPTTPTTQPTEPSYDIYDGHARLSGSRLSWVVYDPYTKLILISDDIKYYAINDTHIYFVKQTEPTNIYVVPIGDFSNHQLYYESTYGNITYFCHLDYRESEIKNYLQFVAEKKKFIMLDTTTGESSVILEAYKIALASTYDPEAEWIMFEGKLTEDSEGGLFDYNRITGELIEDTDCDCEECV